MEEVKFKEVGVTHMLKQFREPSSHAHAKKLMFWTRVDEFGLIMHEQIL